MSLHPFSKDLKEVPTAQIEKQLQELRTKYLKARNPELKMRWYEEQKKLAKDSGKDLDNLINIE